MMTNLPEKDSLISVKKFYVPSIITNKLSYVLFVGLILLCNSINAQGPSFVFVRNAPASSASSPVIQVKWFSNEILNPDGYNLYRREVGTSQWLKVNTIPITRGFVSAASRAADEELDFFIDVVTKSPEDLKEEFLFLNLLLKAFRSNELANFLGNFYNDSGVQFGVTYEYRVGVIQGLSEKFLETSKEIKSQSYTKEGGVKGVEVYQEKKFVAVNWEQDEQSYYGVNIFALKGGTDTVKLNNEPVILTMVPDSVGNYKYPDPMFKASDFEELVSYTILIQGVDYFGGHTEFSKPVLFTYDDTTPPPVPGNLKGVADSLRVKLTWDQETVADFKGFNIYRSVKSTGPFAKVNKNLLDADVRLFKEKLDIPGPYYYTVEAVDHSNNFIRSAPTFVEAQDVFPPSQPQGLTIESDTGRFILRWKMNQEPDLKGYYIYRTVNSNTKGNYVLLTGDPVDTNVYVQVLPKVVKNDFYYYIVAVDTSFNRSPDSKFATAVLPDVTPPEEPFIERIEYSDDGIIIHWTQNVEPDLAGYNVYRSDSINGSREKVNIEPLAAFSFRYVDRSALPNKQYYYSLRAIDDVGNVSAIAKDEAAFWYQNVVIEEPLLLKIKTKKRSRTNRLQWNLIDDPTIKGYIVFRGPSKRVVKPVTKVMAEKFSYTDKVEKDKDYFYQVRAYTTSGQVIYSEIIETKIN